MIAALPLAGAVSQSCFADSTLEQAALPFANTWLTPCENPESANRAGVLLGPVIQQEWADYVYGRKATLEEAAHFKPTGTHIFSSHEDAKESDSVRKCSVFAAFVMGAATQKYIYDLKGRDFQWSGLGRMTDTRRLTYQVVRVAENQWRVELPKPAPAASAATVAKYELRVADSPQRQALMAAFPNMKMKDAVLFGAPTAAACQSLATAWQYFLLPGMDADGIESSSILEGLENTAGSAVGLGGEGICGIDWKTYAGGAVLGAFLAGSEKDDVLALNVLGEAKALEFAFNELRRLNAASTPVVARRTITMDSLRRQYERGDYSALTPKGTTEALDKLTGVVNERIGFIQRYCGAACEEVTQTSTVQKMVPGVGSVKVYIRLTQSKFHPWFFLAPDQLLLTRVAILQSTGYSNLTLCVAELNGRQGCSADGSVERRILEEQRARLRAQQEQKSRADDL